MKKIIILLALFAITTSSFACSKNKVQNDKKSHKTSIIGELPESIDFSNSFRAFWDAFANDTKGLKSLDKYTPSKNLLTHPAISEANGEYCVAGFLTIDDNFDEAAFLALGGEFNRMDATTATFKIPLRKLPEAWNIAGIVSVEASQKVYLRK